MNKEPVPSIVGTNHLPYEQDRSEKSSQLYKGIIQAILAEEHNQISNDDAVWFRLNDLADQELITEREATECWYQYLTQVQPKVKVKRLGEIVSKRARFYE
jgi:hypothetical protein